MSQGSHSSAILDQPTHRMIMRHHPEVGHLYVPDLVARVPHERGGYVIRTNEQGFRSDVPFEPRRDGTPRILVLGDAVTDGQGCDNQERFTDVLADMLGASVYNFGLSGSAPDQQLLIYERLANGIDADLIVWGVAIDTIERITRTHRPSTDRMTGRPILVPKPYFTLDDGQLTLHHVPVPRVRPALDEEGAAHSLDGPRGSWLTGRRALRRMYGAVRNGVARAFPDFPDHMRSLVYRAAGIQICEDYARPEGIAWQLMAALIRRLAVSAEGIPVLIVPLPTASYCVDRIKPIYDPLFESLASPPAGLHVLPITNRLIQRRSLDARRHLFEERGHLSPAGHAAVAQLIATEAERLGLVHRTTTARLRPVERTQARSVLGVSFCAHGAAAALVRDGEVVAAAVEDLFTRRPGQGGFPNLAVNYCLEAAGIHPQGLAGVARARETAALVASQVAWARTQGQIEAWRTVVDGWMSDELVTTTAATEHLHYEGPTFEVRHGAAQCMSAFAEGPFDRAAILSVHGSVDGSVATIAIGASAALRVVKELPGRHGLTDLARHVARKLGLSGRQPFRELAAHADAVRCDEAAIPTGVVRIAADGAFLVETLEGWSPAGVIAAATTIVRRLIQALQKETTEPHLCLVGEVFQVPTIAEAAARAFPSGTISVHGVGGHAVAAIGAALLGWEQVSGVPARPATGLAKARGPAYSDAEVRAVLDTCGFPYRNSAEHDQVVNNLRAEGRRVGVFDDSLTLTGQVTGSDSGGLAPLTPFDAYGELMESGLDAIVMGTCVVLKDEQPEWTPRRRPSSASHRAFDAEQQRRLRRWTQWWLPAAPLSAAESAPLGWVGADATAPCVALERVAPDQVPAQLLSRLPAGQWRTAVRRLLADTLSGKD